MSSILLWFGGVVQLGIGTADDVWNVAEDTTQRASNNKPLKSHLTSLSALWPRCTLSPTPQSQNLHLCQTLMILTVTLIVSLMEVLGVTPPIISTGKVPGHDGLEKSGAKAVWHAQVGRRHRTCCNPRS